MGVSTSTLVYWPETTLNCAGDWQYCLWSGKLRSFSFPRGISASRDLPPWFSWRHLRCGQIRINLKNTSSRWLFIVVCSNIPLGLDMPCTGITYISCTVNYIYIRILPDLLNDHEHSIRVLPFPGTLALRSFVYLFPVFHFISFYIYIGVLSSQGVH